MRYVMWQQLQHVAKVVQVSKSWRLDLCSPHRHLQPLGCHLHLPTHSLKVKMEGKKHNCCTKGPDLGQSCFFIVFFIVFHRSTCTLNRFLSITIQAWNISHVMTSFLHHGNNEVLDVPWRYLMTGWGPPHNSMASCTGWRRPLHLQKAHHHRPKCHLTIDRATGKKTHVVGWHKKFGKARQLPILIHVHSTERNDGDDPTGFHDMCLRSSQWHVWWTTCSSSSDFHQSTSHLLSGCKHF